MDNLSILKGAYDVGTEIVGDYNRGKQMRLGNYKGIDNVKQMGHYNKSGKRLAIYHG